LTKVSMTGTRGRSASFFPYAGVVNKAHVE
jgi:hypothetical protein